MGIGKGELLKNYVGGEWIPSTVSRVEEVKNPATEELLARCPLGSVEDAAAAVAAARAAFPGWRETPVQDRIQFLFRLKQSLEDHAEELAVIVTEENGKTLPESRGSVRRGIQMVEAACGAPSLLMGQSLEEVARGIDCESVRQPMGVFACIAPFNFPAMVPLWFYPFAVACGNTFVCKPSEKVPLSQQFLFRRIEEVGFPGGVLNLVNGGRELTDALLDHPDVEGISFVGSSPVAKHVYTRAAAAGKRVQALGGAKNFLIVMPDADLDAAAAAITESAFGCAGERCLAASIVLPVGASHSELRTKIAARMKSLRLGNGREEGVQLGPLISAEHRTRVVEFVESGVQEGAELVVDGRDAELPERGHFLGPTLFDRVTPSMRIAQEEIFGPVLSLMPVSALEEALEIIHDHPLANASSIFTTSGSAARQFKYRVDASMAGVNIGVAAPMSFFGFGGAKGSFFGDLKAHGRECFDFFTDRKVVISRW